MERSWTLECSSPFSISLDLSTAGVQLLMMKSFLRCFLFKAAAIEHLYAFVEAVLYGVRQRNDGNMGARTSYKHVVPILFSTNVLTRLFRSPLSISSLSTTVIIFWLMLLRVMVWLLRPGELDTRKNGHIFWTKLHEALLLHLCVARHQAWSGWVVQQYLHLMRPRILR